MVVASFPLRKHITVSALISQFLQQRSSSLSTFAPWRCPATRGNPCLVAQRYHP